MPSLEHLEKRIGHRFRDGTLAVEALTHRSHSNDTGVRIHNERLEFLGDSVLGFVVSDRLVQLFPHYSEGRLTKVKAELVRGEALFRAAQEIQLGEHLLLGRAEERNAGRSKKAMQADAVEALIAAIYLDGGLSAAESFIDKFLLHPALVHDADANLSLGNAKSTLQEFLQAHKLPMPNYDVVGQVGPPHSRLFSVRLSIGDLFKTQAESYTKKAAEQAVAAVALETKNDWAKSAD